AFVGLSSSIFSESAISCINELLSRNFVPKNYEGFVLTVASHMRDILGRIVSTPDASTLDPEYLSGFIHFMQVFLKNHLKRVEKFEDFPMNMFLTDFYKFTFLQGNGGENLLYALDVWILFVDYIVDIEF